MAEKVLGLDLSKVTMPEAIAAMVEAWLDAQDVDHDKSCEDLLFNDDLLSNDQDVSRWEWGRINGFSGSAQKTYLALWTIAIKAGFQPKEETRPGWTCPTEYIQPKDKKIFLALIKLLRNGATVRQLKRSVKVWDFESVSSAA